MDAINGDKGSLPFGQGWGQGTINANLWDEWSDTDPRKRATILDAQAELTGFVFTTSCSEDAGYYNKKWMPVTASGSSFDDFNKNYTWWGVYRATNTDTGAPNDNSFQGDHYTDIMLLRLADVMLMHSELTGTADQMNVVRPIQLVVTTIPLVHTQRTLLTLMSLGKPVNSSTSVSMLVSSVAN